MAQSTMMEAVARPKQTKKIIPNRRQIWNFSSLSGAGGCSSGCIKISLASL